MQMTNSRTKAVRWLGVRALLFAPLFALAQNCTDLTEVPHAAPSLVNRFEAEFGTSEGEVFEPSPRSRLRRRNGRPLWSVTVPANGTATLRYRLRPAG